MLFYLQTALLLVFPAMVTVAGLRDLTSYIIPNWISLVLLAAFVPAALALGLPMGQIGLHLAVGLGGLVLGMALYALGWIGGGDAKLFAAAALWIGWPALVLYVAVVCMAGGAFAVLLIGLRSAWLRPFIPSGPAWFGRLVEPGENVPYGVAIAVGAMAAFPGSNLMQALSSAS